MTLIPVADPGDHRLDAFRAIGDPELVRRRGQFVAEGRLVVGRLIADGRYSFGSLMLSDAAARALQAAGSLAALPASVPVYVCPIAAFLNVTGFNIHRGCLALVRRPEAIEVLDIVASSRLVVVLEDVTNADNVGGVFRNVAAFGGDAVLLSPRCCDPLYRKAVRTSMGATLKVPFATLPRWPGDLQTLRGQGYTMAALTPRQPSETLDEFVADVSTHQHGGFGRMALLVGTEGAGLSAEADAAADRRVRIPIEPAVDSLNLAVAVGIALSRLRVDAVKLTGAPHLA
jgi:tRNA G18 (ribose-2'-O)-methylase SpoU